MSTGLIDALVLGEVVLERQMAGIALVQPDLAANFTVLPEVDKGAKAFFTRFSTTYSIGGLKRLGLQLT